MSEESSRDHPTHVWEALENDDEENIRRLMRNKLADPYNNIPMLPQGIEYLLDKLEEKDEKIEELKEKLDDS